MEKIKDEELESIARTIFDQVDFSSMDFQYAELIEENTKIQMEIIGHVCNYPELYDTLVKQAKIKTLIDEERFIQYFVKGFLSGYKMNK